MDAGCVSAMGGSGKSDKEDGWWLIRSGRKIVSSEELIFNLFSFSPAQAGWRSDKFTFNQARRGETKRESERNW